MAKNKKLKRQRMKGPWRLVCNTILIVIALVAFVSIFGDGGSDSAHLAQIKPNPPVIWNANVWRVLADGWGYRAARYMRLQTPVGNLAGLLVIFGFAALIANKLSRRLHRAVATVAVIMVVSGTYMSVGANCAGGSDTSASISPQPQPGVVYFLDDHQGNTHLITDSVGNIVHEESRYPYGVKRYDQNTADNSDAVSESKPYYSYTGKEYDEETGLIYFGGRYYAPELGRWITPDPLFLEKDPRRSISNPLEQNLYSYAINNPISYVDAVGEDVLSVALLNLTEWIAEEPVGGSPSRYGKMAELGFAVEVKSFVWSDMLSMDNYDIRLYATKGFPAQQYDGASGLDVGAGLNVSYLAGGARFDDFQGKAIEHVGAVGAYGMSEITTESNKQGWSFAWTPGGAGLGTFTFETETKVNIQSLGDLWNFYQGNTTNNSTITTSDGGGL